MLCFRECIINPSSNWFILYELFEESTYRGGRASLAEQIVMKLILPIYSESCYTNFVLVCVCPVYPMLSVKPNSECFLKSSLLYKILLCDMKYRLHYAIQLLFETFFIMVNI
jgi:hypothetical protein